MKGWAALVALVVFSCGGASAETADNCTFSSGQFTIASQADADTLAGCPNITGSIRIQTEDATAIHLRGVSYINGSLDAISSSHLVNISAPELRTIVGDSTLSNLPLFERFHLPYLDDIYGAITWNDLPVFDIVVFGDSKPSRYGLPGTNAKGNITIMNTGLAAIDFLNFTFDGTAEVITMQDNPVLNNINLTTLNWISTSVVQFTNNGPSTQIYLPTLQAVSQLVVSNASSLLIPALQETQSDLNLTGNTFKALSARNLTNVGGALILENNAQLATLDLPFLETIGGEFLIQNNSALTNITDMEKLFGIQGNIDMTGNFTNVTLAGLHNINSGFYLHSTNPGFDCSVFDQIHYDSAHNSASYSCSASAVGSTSDQAKHYSQPSTFSGLSKVAQSLIIIIIVIVGLLVLVLLLRLWNSKRHPRVPEEQPPIDLGDVGVNRESTGGDQPPKYSRVGKPGEVPPDYEAQRPDMPSVPPKARRPWLRIRRIRIW